jgi:hypothetical protein
MLCLEDVDIENIEDRSVRVDSLKFFRAVNSLRGYEYTIDFGPASVDLTSNDRRFTLAIQDDSILRSDHTISMLDSGEEITPYEMHNTLQEHVSVITNNGMIVFSPEKIISVDSKSNHMICITGVPYANLKENVEITEKGVTTTIPVTYGILGSELNALKTFMDLNISECSISANINKGKLVSVSYDAMLGTNVLTLEQRILEESTYNALLQVGAKADQFSPPNYVRVSPTDMYDCCKSAPISDDEGSCDLTFTNKTDRDKATIKSQSELFVDQLSIHTDIDEFTICFKSSDMKNISKAVAARLTLMSIGLDPNQMAMEITVDDTKYFLACLYGEGENAYSVIPDKTKQVTATP